MKILTPKTSTPKLSEIKPRKKLGWPKSSDFVRLWQKVRQPCHPNWFRISVFANIAVLVIAVIGFGGVELIHQSDTNPYLCNMCHVMRSNVASYTTSNHLDNVHLKAGVQCKDCHNYPVTAEITSAVNFVIGNYAVDPTGELIQRKYDDSMCTKCHLSNDHLIYSTDYLHRNPHNSHWGYLACSSCHFSHTAQFDYCSQCHENGGQRMIENPSKPRGTIGS